VEEVEEAAEEEEPAKKKKKKEKKDKKEKKEKSEATEEAEADEAPAADSTGVSVEEFRKEAQITLGVGSSSALPDPVQTLAAAPFGKKIYKGLVDMGFAAPTAIQAQGWPVAMSGNDLIAVAKTGSGKTLAFLLPFLFRMSRDGSSASPELLVLAPTRELAVQIHEASAKFGAMVGIDSCVVYGGVPKPPQIKLLKAKPPVVVATPGRLVDLMGDGGVHLGGIKYLVLDEADRMLDMGFEPQMADIMKEVPKESRQTCLFSATWPKSVKKLAANYLNKNAVHVNVGETEELAANKSVTQEFFRKSDDEKENQLWKIWDGLIELGETSFKMIVFANTKRRIEHLQRQVKLAGYKCVVMHGDKTQAERDAGLSDFVGCKVQVMFATDVCARGLDIKGVTHVVNFDMARDVESYVHRIGRTGRAGTSGTSITFFNEDYDMECAPALLKIAQEAGQTVPEFLERAAAKGGKSKNKLWKY